MLRQQIVPERSWLTYTQTRNLGGQEGSTA
jgi:hypothetical protein